MYDDKLTKRDPNMSKFFWKLKSCLCFYVSVFYKIFKQILFSECTIHRLFEKGGRLIESPASSSTVISLQPVSRGLSNITISYREY